VPAKTRDERIDARERNPKWQNPPLRIEMSECINCDACLRHCPEQFGAIFNHGIDVIILPELCSGCLKCIPVCPVDCIYPDPDWTPSADDWWKHPGNPGDPYT
jgi:electron transport complex protein RnfB